MYSTYCRNHQTALTKYTEFMKRAEFASTIKVNL